MRTALNQTDPQFDRVFHVLDKPLPASPMIDPKYFLSINEDAIMYGLNASRREQQRITLTKFSAAFAVFTAIAMLLTFSREARAFVQEVFYTVSEWFSPEQNESGVTFDIEDSEHSSAPSMSDTGEKSGFNDLSEADKLYSGKVYVLNNGSFAFSDGYIQDNIICLNYYADESHVQIICEPIQDSGSVVYHFNDDEFYKTDIPDVGTFYHRLEEDGTLFGGIMTSDTSIIVRADNASPELLELIVHSISRSR
jgi:hypothetical protein